MNLSLSGKTSLVGFRLQKSQAGFVPTHSGFEKQLCPPEPDMVPVPLRASGSAAMTVFLLLIKGSSCEFSVIHNKYSSRKPR